MADSVVKVLLQIETLVPGVTSSSGSPGAGGGGATSASKSTAELDLSTLKKEFDSLVTGLRTLALSVAQVNTAVDALKQGSQAAPGATGASRASSAGSGLVDPSGRAISSALTKAVEAEKAAATATEESTTATIESTKATTDHAEALKDEAEAAAKASAISGATGSALEALHRHLYKVHGAANEVGDAAGASADAFTDFSKRMNGGTLTAAGMFAKVLAPVASDPAFRERARQVRTNMDSFFQIPQGLSDSGKAAAEDLKKDLQNAINAALRNLSTSDITTNTSKIFSELVGNITDQLEEVRKVGGPAIKFDLTKFSESFKAEEFITLASQVEQAAKKFKEAQAAGLDLTAFSDDFEHAVNRLIRLTSKELGNTRRDTFRLQDPTSGARIDHAQNLAQEIRPAAAQLDLSKLQQTMVNLARDTIKARQPLEVATDLFRLLSGDLKNFEDNVRKVRLGIEQFDAADVGGTEAFAKAQELLRMVNLKRTTSGEIRGPTDVARGEPSAIFARARINELRQGLAGAQQGSTRGATINITDASGNVRRISLELKQMGSTIDSVRVKAKELSDNMFDRASVRTALQRVAVWGTAAGIVFGAVNAFKTAISTVVETEASVTTLAKVMDEAQSGFEKFKQTATQTAIAISQEFGQPIKDVIQTMTTFAQQGKNLPEVTQLTKASALAANVTTLDQPTAGSVLTSVTEQFNLDPIKDATSIIDKFNNVANNAAVTETQLAEALKRAGNAAVNAGVNLDQFNGMVAAISEQTRQTGSEIGTALKFIFSRIGTERAEAGLNAVNVSVRDAAGAVRPFVDILEELSVRFQTLSASQQTQVAISVAGAHRFNTLLALIKNFDQYQKSLVDSTDSAGSAMREQARVAETAQFKIQQLKNSVSATALAFGSAFLPVLKGATGIAKGFFDVLSGAPPAFTLLTSSLGLSFVAFTKLSNQMVNFIDLFDKGASKAGIFGTVIGALGGPGVGREEQLIKDPASIARFSQAGSGIIAAREVGDFAFKKGGEGVKDFAQQLKLSNLTLVDMHGNVVKNTQGMTKFAAVTRGLGTTGLDEAGKATGRVNLGIAAMNSGAGRLAATFVKFTSYFTGSLPIVGNFFKTFQAGAEAANVGTRALLASVISVVATTAVIAAAVYGFIALKNAGQESGESIREGLKEEIATRQEAISKIKDQQNQLKSLSSARAAAAVNAAIVENQDPAIRDESIRRGNFKSPFLDNIRLNQARQEAENNIGFANPEAIKSIDQFGNVVLKSAQAFDTLAESAKSAQVEILAATQVNVIEGFIKDLDGDISDSLGKTVAKIGSRILGGAAQVLTLGFTHPFKEFGDDEGKKYRNRLAELKEIQDDPRVQEALSLNVDLSLTAPELAKTLDKKVQEVAEAGEKFREVIEKINSEIAKLPEGTAEKLLRSRDFDAFAETEAQRLSTQKGFSISSKDLRQQILLKNSGALSGVKASIGSNAEETRATLNEKGILGSKLDVTGDIEKKLKGLKGGELVLTKIFGSDATQQLEVVVDAFGNRLVKQWDNATRRLKFRSLAEIIKQQGTTEIEFFDAGKIKKQIDAIALELRRVVSGGARGALLSSDLDLGVTRNFQATGQQRASIDNSLLFSDIVEGREKIEDILTLFKAPIEEGDTGIALEKLREFNKLSIDQENLETLFKFKAEIAALGNTFEEALDKIDANELKDKISSLFPTGLGADAGLIEDRSGGKPLLRSQFTGEQVVRDQARNLIISTNRIVDSNKALADLFTGRAEVSRNAALVADEIRASQAAGGVRDPKELSDLTKRALGRAEGGVKVGENLTAALIEQGNREAEAQTRLLSDIAQTLKDPTGKDIGGNLLAAAKAASDGDVTKIDKLAQVVEGLGAKGLSNQSVKTTDLVEVAKVLQDKSPEVLRNALIERQAPGVAGSLAGTLIARGAPKEGEEKREIPKASVEFKETEGKLAEIFSRFARQKEPITDDTAIAAGLEVANQLKSVPWDDMAEAIAGRDKSPLIETGKALEQDLLRGDRATIDEIKQSLASLQQLPAPAQSVSAPKENVLKFDEYQQALQTLTSAALSAAAAFGDRFIQPLVQAASAAKLVAYEAGELKVGLAGLTNSTLEAIAVSRSLADLAAGSQSGELAGVLTPSFDLGKTREELSGSERAFKDNQDLVTSGNELNTIFGAAKSKIEQVTKSEQKLAAARRELLEKGNLQGVNTIDKASREISTLKQSLVSNATSVAAALHKVGDSLRRLKVIQEVSSDVEKMIDSFTRARDNDFDRTSIDTALGKTPFSFTRPTFEQFQEGQGGRLTKFEREQESIDFKQRTGQLSFADAKTARERSEFENKEEIIARAQSVETDKFQRETSAAEQVRNKLLEFSASGSPDAGFAKNLADRLGDELAEAGDIIKSNLPGRKVRDPRTGEEVDVPASEVLQFKGVPGLEAVREELAKIAAKAKEEEAQTDAKPIVEALQSASDAITGRLDDLIKQADEDPSLAISEEAQKAFIAAAGDMNKAIEKMGAVEDLAKAAKTMIDNFNSQAQGGINPPPSPAAPEPAAHATGGMIKGPGGPKEDRVPIMASPGEYVLQASAVKKLGLSALSALNQGKFPQKLADGGAVFRLDELLKLPGQVAEAPGKLEDALNAIRGNEVITYDSEGKEIRSYEGIEEVKYGQSLDERIAKAKTDKEIIDELQANRQNNLERKRRGEGLRLDHAHPGINVVYQENGRPLFTNADMGVPLDGRVVGMDLSSEDSFRRDSERRLKLVNQKGLRENLILEKKALEDQRLKRIVGGYGANRLERSSEGVEAGINARTGGLLSQAQRHINILNGLARRMTTPEGRLGLGAFEEDVQNEFRSSSIALQNLIAKVKQLKKGPVNITNPVDSSVNKIMDAYFGETGFVSPDGKVTGEVYSGDDSLYSMFNSGELEDLIKAAGAASEYAKNSNSLISGEYLDSLTDTVRTSDGPQVLKNAAVIGLGAAKGLEKGAKFALKNPHLVIGGIVAPWATAGILAANYVRKKGVRGAVEGVGEIGTALGEGAGKIYTGLSEGSSADDYYAALDSIGGVGATAIQAYIGGRIQNSAVAKTAQAAVRSGAAIAGRKAIGYGRSAIEAARPLAGRLASGVAAVPKRIGNYIKASRLERAAAREAATASQATRAASVNEIADYAKEIEKRTGVSAAEAMEQATEALKKGIPVSGIPSKKSTLAKVVGSALLGSGLEVAGTALGFPGVGSALKWGVGIGGGLRAIGRHYAAWRGRGKGLLGAAEGAAEEAGTLARVGEGTTAAGAFDDIELGPLGGRNMTPEGITKQLANAKPSTIEELFGKKPGPVPDVGSRRSVGIADPNYGGVFDSLELSKAPLSAAEVAARRSAAAAARAARTAPSVRAPRSAVGVADPNYGGIAVRPGAIDIPGTTPHIPAKSPIDIINSRKPANDLNKAIAGANAEAAGANLGIDPSKAIQNQLIDRLRLKKLEGQRGSISANLLAPKFLQNAAANFGEYFRNIFRRGKNRAGLPSALGGDGLPSSNNLLERAEGTGSAGSDALDFNEFSSGPSESMLRAQADLERQIAEYAATIDADRFVRLQNIEDLRAGDLKPGHPGFDPERLAWKGGVPEAPYAPTPGRLGWLRDIFRAEGPNSPRWFSSSPAISAGYVDDAAGAAELRAYDISKIPERAGSVKSQGPFTPHIAVDSRIHSRRHVERLSKKAMSDKRAANIVTRSDVSKDPYYEKVIGRGYVPEPIATYRPTSIRGIYEQLTGEKLLPSTKLTLDELKELMLASRESLKLRDGGLIAGFASGGQINGPGGPREDRVPILASPGEFVINADSVKKLGTPLMNFINENGRIPFGAMPRFADGGIVGSSAGASGASVEVRVDAQQITEAVSAGVVNGMSNAKVALDVPAEGVKIDTSAFQSMGTGTGGDLGAAVRNRLEAVEGRVEAIREDAKATTEKLGLLENKIEAQKVDILATIMTDINQRLSDFQNGLGTGASDSGLAQFKSEAGARFTNLEQLVQVAMDTSSKALSQSMARG